MTDAGDGKAMNPKSKRITTNNQQKSHRVSSDGSRDTDTNPSMKDKMDKKCSNKNTVEKEGQQSINQPILFTSDNTESHHTNIYTDGNIGFLQTNTEQSLLDQGCQKKTQDGKPENHYRFTKHTECNGKLCIFTESSEYLRHPMSARTLDDVIRKA